MATFDPMTVNSTTLGLGDKQHVAYVKTEETAEKPSILALDAVDPSTAVRTTYYLWADSAGKLRIGTSLPTDENSSGTKVGTQS